MKNPFDFNGNGELDLIDFLITSELDPNNPLNADPLNDEDLEIEYDIETDTGPDDDMETYEYYYGDDEIVGNDEW